MVICKKKVLGGGTLAGSWRRTNLFYMRDEWVRDGKIQIRKCDSGGFQTAGQRAGVICFWNWDFGGGYPICPKSVRFFGLLNPVFGYSSIIPYDRPVSVQLRPVTLTSISVSIGFEWVQRKASLRPRPGSHRSPRQRYGSPLRGALRKEACIGYSCDYHHSSGRLLAWIAPIGSFHDQGRTWGPSRKNDRLNQGC